MVLLPKIPATSWSAAGTCTLWLVMAHVTPCPAQDTDWAAYVEKAHNHRRIMLRRAAARKVADAGAAAVPAVRAFQKKHGRDAIRMVLVSSYAVSKTTDAATLGLLLEWAGDRDFYWRSQALKGLANRRRPELKKLFTSNLQDPAYLTRIEAGRGLCLLGDHSRTLGLLADVDPRVRLRVAVCLVEEGNDRGLPTLIEALRQETSFLDYPWGQIGAIVAFKTMRKLAAQDFGFVPGESRTKNGDAVAGFEKWARVRLGKNWVDPVQIPGDDTSYLGGIEIRSCRNGDMFLRWTADQVLVIGLEGRTRIQLDDSAFSNLDAGPQTTGETRHGKVVCDFLRWACKTTGKSQKAAPKALPAESSKWLESLAKALDKKGASEFTKRLQNRLQQFRARRP
ncbi:MAG: hypothetical protein VX951_07135 [Planctomycetota bacterium]|nr:hypothetical protein [Planctomycetota bacterium]